MKELLLAAFAPANFVFSVLLLVSLLYWLTVFIGLFDIDAIDVGKDWELAADTSFEIEKGIEVNKGVEVSVVGKRPGFWNRLLVFLNLGKIPFMIWFSFFILMAWAFSLLGNFYLSGGNLLGAALLLPFNLGLSALLAKGITKPLVPIFKSEKNEFRTQQDFIGQICRIEVPAKGLALGQASIRTSQAPVRIIVQALPEQELLKGSEGLIVDYDATQRIFLVSPFEHSLEAKKD